LDFYHNYNFKVAIVVFHVVLQDIKSFWEWPTNRKL